MQAYPYILIAFGNLLVLRYIQGMFKFKGMFKGISLISITKNILFICIVIH